MVDYIYDFWRNRILIWELTKKDFYQRYVGNVLGVMWAFIQPTIQILIFWFVFQVGFKSMPVDNFPFILWLVCGMFPWFFFSDSLNGATSSIIGNSFLVKKVVFRVSLLPVVQIISAYLVHLFFVVMLYFMFIFYGYWPDLYCFQIFYYDFAVFVLLFGLSLITASLVVFLKDIGQFVSMILQFGFWLTPIFWSPKILPKKFIWLFDYNPMYYIVNGYRDSFINKVWFWEHGVLSIKYWIITGIILGLGMYLFKKLRPHFADVL